MANFMPLVFFPDVVHEGSGDDGRKTVEVQETFTFLLPDGGRIEVAIRRDDGDAMLYARGPAGIQMLVDNKDVVGLHRYT